LDPTKIIETVSVFDDKEPQTKTLQAHMGKDPTIWQKCYLNKQEHKEVLGATIWSNSLEDFSRFKAAGS
jgi:hypothetical protein